jgi:hypothetical protein
LLPEEIVHSEIREGTYAEPGHVFELRRCVGNTGRPRWLKFVRESTKQEIAAETEKSRELLSSHTHPPSVSVYKETS